MFGIRVRKENKILKERIEELELIKQYDDEYIEMLESIKEELWEQINHIAKDYEDFRKEVIDRLKGIDARVVPAIATILEKNEQMESRIKKYEEKKMQDQEKAANARHGLNRSRKETVIAEWYRYKTKQESLGKQASKNAFAQRTAEKYSVSVETVRKNWLQWL